MSTKLNVAILGAGNIAKSMATALKGISDEVRMYAVASRSIEKAKAFAAEWGFEKAYGSYQDLVKDDNVDLIYVATPHSEHFKNAMMCIEAGKNCLVEKPICVNRTQAEKLFAAAAEKGVFVTEAMWTRYQPSRKLICDLIGSGKIGKVHYMESDFSVPIEGVERLSNPELAGGALLDLGIYSLTAPAMYLGTDVRKVKMSMVMSDTNVDATTIATLTYADGTMARAKCSMTDAANMDVKIVGDKGYMVFGPIHVPNEVRIYNLDGDIQETIPISFIANGYEYEVLECKAAIKEGKLEAESMPHAETIRMMGWMDSIRNHAGFVYPFESKEDISISDEAAWGVSDVFDDVNPWDRSNTRSFLEVYDIETGERKKLATFEDVIEAPNWSHDGTFMTYNSNGKIFKFDLATKTSTMVYSGNLDKINNDHVLSTDDSEIAVSDESQLDEKSRIYRVPLSAAKPVNADEPVSGCEFLNGGEPVLVTKDAPSYLHGWSPDTEYFCYCAERNGEYDVYEIKKDGTDETRLTTAPCLNDGSEYDSEGEYIYFNSVRAGLMQAWRMKRDGSEQTQLTFDSNLNTWFPHISPDRTKIVMVSYYKGDLWPGDHVPNKNVEIRYMNADGTGLKTLMKIFGGQGTINVNSWSPDSKKFAFVSYERI